VAELRRKGPNKYLIMIYLGREEKSGKKKYYSEVFNGKLTEARLRAAELEASLKKYTGPAKSMFLGQYLENWLAKIEGTVSERAHRTYSWHVRRLKEALDRVPMYNLTAYELQEALSRLGGLSPRTLKGLYGTLRTALRQAVAWGLLPSDPTVGLRAPRVPRRERKVLTQEELRALLEAAKSYKYYLVLRLLVLTGMRLGEVLGLKWQDIDLKKGTLTVKRAADGRNRKLKQQPKTASSERTFKLDEETVRLLAAHKKEQKVVAMKNRDSGLVFSHEGRVVREDAIRRTLNYALKKAGLPRIRVHDLRHTAGSLLLDAGYSLSVVASFLGHSSPATTAAVYAHAVRKGGNVIDLLEEAGREANQTANQEKKDQ